MFSQPILPRVNFRYIEKYEPNFNIPPSIYKPVTVHKYNKTTSRQDSLNKQFADILKLYGDKLAALNIPRRDSVVVNVNVHPCENPDMLLMGMNKYNEKNNKPSIDTTYLIIQYKITRRNGWLKIGSGLLLQTCAATLVATQIKSSSITLSKDKTKIITDSNLKHDGTIAAVSSLMVLNGVLLEIFGAIELRDAHNLKISLGRISIDLIRKK